MDGRKMVSVVIVACGGAERLLDLVASVYPQLDSGDEILIAVAAPGAGLPSDMTREIAAEVARQIPIARVITDEAGDSLCTASAPALVSSLFEQAVRACKGSYVFLAEPGDIWLPGKVSDVLDAFAMSGSVLTLHDAELHDTAGNLQTPSLMALPGSKPGLGGSLVGNFYLGSCLAFLGPFREFFLPVPAEAVRYDQWVGLVSELFGGVALLAKPLVRKTVGLKDGFAADASGLHGAGTDAATNAAADAIGNRTPYTYASAFSPWGRQNEQRKLLKALKKRERELGSVLRQLKQKDRREN